MRKKGLLNVEQRREFILRAMGEYASELGVDITSVELERIGE